MVDAVERKYLSEMGLGNLVGSPTPSTI